MHSLHDFAEKLGVWADATFGHGDPLRPLKHLQEEAREVLAEPTDRYEYADCLMLLLDAHRRAGLGGAEELLAACYEKLEICKQRKWGPKDANGVIRHVESERL